MKKIILLLILFSSCRSLEQIKLQASLLEDYAIFVEVNQKKEYVVLMWPCAEAPFKNQPCYGVSEHPISLFENPVLGDTLKIVKR